jgi:D-alanine--poly(phosphoribitol) ligase subunit 1
MVQKFYKDLLEVMKNASGDVYTYYGKTHSYKKLYGIIKKVYTLLQDRKKEGILLYGSKSLATYGAIFGILFSDNTWIPLSTELPVNRLIEIMKVTGARLLIADIPLPEEIVTFACAEEIKLVQMSDLTEKAEGKEVELPLYFKDDVAYIMCTSGSTGKPKGVPMTHENYINFIRNCMEILPFKKYDVFSDYHDFAFDISIFYLFCCPLVEGVFAPVLTQEDKVLALRFMQENHVTVWSSVPSVIARIQQFYPAKQPETDVRIMFLCGEPFSLKVLKYCQENFRVPHIYNFYGLTETGVENFYHKCSMNDLHIFEPFGHVPIGRPLKGNDVFVTSEKELMLSGCQITPGYLGGAGKDKFEDIDGKKWFHSGDIVEQHEGLFFCKGRIDSQIKLSGYRIELMDIEVNIKRFPGVEDAVCFVAERKEKKSLTAVVKLQNRDNFDMNKLRDFLNKEMPGYMVPVKILITDEIPVNNNGKIDRSSVKEMFRSK